MASKYYLISSMFSFKFYFVLYFCNVNSIINFVYFAIRCLYFYFNLFQYFRLASFKSYLCILHSVCAVSVIGPRAVEQTPN